MSEFGSCLNMVASGTWRLFTLSVRLLWPLFIAAARVAGGRSESLRETILTQVFSASTESSGERRRGVPNKTLDIIYYHLSLGRNKYLTWETANSCYVQKELTREILMARSQVICSFGYNSTIKSRCLRVTCHCPRGARVYTFPLLERYSILWANRVAGAFLTLK